MKQYTRNGFTFIETIIVMSVFLVLIGLAGMSLLGSQRSANLFEAVDVFRADLQSQQTKSMTGVGVSGVTPAGYGIYIEEQRYVLFSGSSYDPNDPANAVTIFKSPLVASSIGFPGRTVLFLAKSGEVSGYIAGQNFVTLTEANSGNTKTIYINKYGVITAIL